MITAFLLGCMATLANSGKFGYSETSQRTWPSSCFGTHQSPVAIDSHAALPLAIPALEMVGFNNLIPRPISVINNGHSVEIKPGRKFAKIFGALLDGEYDVQGFHFHWGRSNNKGSEHIINGMRFSMEMHVVSKNIKYDTLDDAFVAEDGLAVLAFFFDVREKSNPALEPILSELKLIRPEGSVTYMYQSFTLASLLPTDTNMFYTYRGSLTTPPCSEAVTWIIFPDPMGISIEQMDEFRGLLADDNVHMVDNYRIQQDRKTRKVFIRRGPVEVTPTRNIYKNFSSNVFWEQKRLRRHSFFLKKKRTYS